MKRTPREDLKQETLSKKKSVHPLTNSNVPQKPHTQLSFSIELEKLIHKTMIPLDSSKSLGHNWNAWIMTTCKFTSNMEREMPLPVLLHASTTSNISLILVIHPQMVLALMRDQITLELLNHKLKTWFLSHHWTFVTKLTLPKRDVKCLDIKSTSLLKM